MENLEELGITTTIYQLHNEKIINKFNIKKMYYEEKITKETFKKRRQNIQITINALEQYYGKATTEQKKNIDEMLEELKKTKE